MRQLRVSLFWKVGWEEGKNPALEFSSEITGVRD